MSLSAPTGKLLCLTMLGYMKAGLTEDELYHFQIEKHAQLVSGLMEKYGVKRYTIVRIPQLTSSIIERIDLPIFPDSQHQSHSRSPSTIV